MPPAIPARIGYNPIPTNRPYDRNLLLLRDCFAIALLSLRRQNKKQGPGFRRSPSFFCFSSP